ncbi:hypothetical protein KSS87_015394 [Heliosperma pusillum]|nr:hypothetical protein KSS87_015394 [Heliosperma pusillum]
MVLTDCTLIVNQNYLVWNFGRDNSLSITVYSVKFEFKLLSMCYSLCAQFFNAMILYYLSNSLQPPFAQCPHHCSMITMSHILEIESATEYV